MIAVTPFISWARRQVSLSAQFSSVPAGALNATSAETGCAARVRIRESSARLARVQLQRGCANITNVMPSEARVSLLAGGHPDAALPESEGVFLYFVRAARPPTTASAQSTTS